ncbi:MAG: TAXI family TRAP transporter solute-binding subunit [Pseudomonadota bacterium]
MNKKNAAIILTAFCMALTFSVLSFPKISMGQSSLPPVLNLATHPLGSKYNALGSGIGTVLSAHLSTEFKVMPTGGPAVWLPMIRTEEVDLGVANGWDSKMGYLAAGPYKKIMGGKGAPVRLICNGSPNLNAVITAANTDIKTGKDLRGKRFVGMFTGSAAITAQAEAALANFGLTSSDVKFISVPGVSQGVKSIIEGRADASGSAVIGMGVIAELDAKRGARFLSFDPSPEAAKRYADIFPAVPVKVEPGPKRIGVREPIYMMKYDTYLIGAKTLSDETAYQIAKTLWDYNKELWPIHAALKSWTTDLFVTKNATVPYHPGVIKFYKEKGAWDAEMDKVQSRLLSSGN